MSYAHRLAAPRAGEAALPKTPLAVQTPQRRARPMLRSYDVACLNDSGEVTRFNRLAPATPLFEQAFNAFARGTLIATPGGPVAIEDLSPGDLVTTPEGSAKVLWIGGMTLYPGRIDEQSREGLVRLTADALGFGRPMSDLLLGPGARILPPRADELAPARCLIDGEYAFPLEPISPVSVFHLCVEGQSLVYANGLAAETFRPDPASLTQVEPALRALFMAMFPHVEAPRDPGAMRPRRLGSGYDFAS